MFSYIKCMKNYGKSDARLHCANWNNGKCLGCMMSSKNGVLMVEIDSKLADKECIVTDGCDYFDRVVVPGIKK